jgi:hypothetical protein
MGTRTSDKQQVSQLFTWTCTNQTTSWLVHNWNTFGTWTNHGQTWIHKTHHDLDLGGSHHLPLYNILCAWSQDLHPNVILSRDPQVGSPEIPKIGTLVTLKAHNFLCRPPIEVRFEAKL